MSENPVPKRTFTQRQLDQRRAKDKNSSDSLPAEEAPDGREQAEPPIRSPEQQIGDFTPPEFRPKVRRALESYNLVAYLVGIGLLIAGLAKYMPWSSEPSHQAQPAPEPKAAAPDPVTAAENRLKTMYDLGAMLYSYKGHSMWMTSTLSSQFELTDTMDSGFVNLSQTMLTLRTPGFSSKRTGPIAKGVIGHIPLEPTWSPRILSIDPQLYQMDLLILDNRPGALLYALGFKSPAPQTNGTYPQFSFRFHSLLFSSQLNAKRPDTILVELTIHNQGQPTTAEWADNVKLFTPGRTNLGTRLHLKEVYESGDSTGSLTINEADWLHVKTSTPIGPNGSARGFLFFQFEDLPDFSVLTEPTVTLQLFVRDNANREARVLIPVGGSPLPISKHSRRGKGIPLPATPR